MLFYLYLLLFIYFSGKSITGDEIDLGHSRVKKSDIDKPDPNKDVTTLEEALADIDHAISLGKPTPGTTECGDNKHKDNVNIETNPTHLKHGTKHENNIENTEETSRSIVDKHVENICDVKNNLREAGNDRYISVTSQYDTHTDSQEKSVKDVERATSESTQIIPPAKCEVKNNLVKEIVENKQPELNSAKFKTEEYINNDLRKESHFNQPSSQATKKTTPTETAKRKDAKENLNKGRAKILALESNLRQWISVDTLILLLGEAVVQSALVKANKHYKEHTKLMKQLDATTELNMNEILGKHVSINFSKSSTDWSDKL